MAEQQAGFVPAVVVAGIGAAGAAAIGIGRPAAAIEIEFASGARMRITGAVDAAMLTAAVAALSGGRPR